MSYTADDGGYHATVQYQGDAHHQPEHDPVVSHRLHQSLEEVAEDDEVGVITKVQSLPTINKHQHAAPSQGQGNVKGVEQNYRYSPYI